MDSFSPMEIAKHFYRLKTKFTWSDKNLAGQSTGQYKKSQISVMVALNKLPKQIRDLVHKKELGVMPAYELSRLAYDVDLAGGEDDSKTGTTKSSLVFSSQRIGQLVALTKLPKELRALIHKNH